MATDDEASTVSRASTASTASTANATSPEDDDTEGMTKPAQSVGHQPRQLQLPRHQKTTTQRVLVDAIVNTGPREDSTCIGSQGTVRRQAVDVSPLRRVNQSISLITTGISHS